MHGTVSTNRAYDFIHSLVFTYTGTPQQLPINNTDMRILIGVFTFRNSSKLHSATGNKKLNKTELQHAYAALTETDHDVTNLKFVFLSTTYIDNCHELVRFLYVIAKLCMYISCLNMVNNCSFGCYMKRMNHIRAIIVWYEQFWVQWDVEYF